MDIDDFEDFSYDDEASQTELHSFAIDDAKQQRRRTKQQKFTLEDTSSEEDEEELPEASYKSSSKLSSTTRKLTSRKKKSTKVSIDSKRLTPTVSSPKITLSSIAKKESSVRPPPKNNNSKSNNKDASSKRGSSKKGPIGKPIKSASRGKKSNNDENYDNDAEQLDEGRQRATRSRRKKGATAAADNTSSVKKQQQQQNVSFANKTRKNGDDVLEKGTPMMDGEDNNEAVDTTPDTSSINKDHSSKIQVLPLRAIAIDNRTLPTFAADSTSRKSFFEQLPDFLEGMMQKGVLQPQLPRRNNDAHVKGTSIIASLVHGTTSSRISGKGIGARVEQSVVPRASFLLEEASGGRVSNSERNEWLSEFLSPINHGLESAVRNDTDVEAGFGAQDSWKYFGDLGKRFFVSVHIGYIVTGCLTLTPPSLNNSCFSRGHRRQAIQRYCQHQTQLSAKASMLNHTLHYRCHILC